MADFFVIVAKSMTRHPTLREAESERGRLSEKHPEKQFRILRCGESLHKEVGRATSKMESEP